MLLAVPKCYPNIHPFQYLRVQSQWYWGSFKKQTEPPKRETHGISGIFLSPAAWGPCKMNGWIQQLYTPAVWISAPGIPGFFWVLPSFWGCILETLGWVGKLRIESHQMVNPPLKYPAKIHLSRWRMLTIFGGMKFHPRFVPPKKIRNWKLYWPSLAKCQLFLCQFIFSGFFKPVT